MSLYVWASVYKLKIIPKVFCCIHIIYIYIHTFFHIHVSIHIYIYIYIYLFIYLCNMGAQCSPLHLCGFATLVILTRHVCTSLGFRV